MNFRDEIAKTISEGLNVTTNEVVEALEVPPDYALGDYAFPCFKFASKSGKKPNELAKELSETIKLDFVENIETKGAYLNFFIKAENVVENVLSEISEKKECYGSTNEGKGKTVVMDYSSPNIAKPFGIGHLRSTVIGNSIYRILKFRGYNCVGVNHLGDWGTQFGKLIVAYENWGEEKKLEKDPIKHLLDIYVKFHDEAKINPELDEEAREEFRKLENGNKKSLAIWEMFKELSLKEFEKYYAELNIEFDSNAGESFYNDKMDAAIKTLEKKVKTELSDGALVVELEKMPPFMLKKTNGSSTYHTRDLAAAIYRLTEYKADKLLYVVGAPQKLHFKQLFSVLGKMGHEESKFEHVDFGHFLGMSTRKGNIIFLEDVLDKGIELAKKIISVKNPKLKNKNEVAKMVGIGAIIFGDLSSDRVKDVEFDWGRILNFEGESGPYVQYTHARCCSVLKKSETEIKKTGLKWDKFTSEEELKLIKHLGSFENAIEQAAKQYKPSIIARYLLDLCGLFNSFYAKHKIIGSEEELLQLRLLLVDSVRTIIDSGLNLLGIKAPEEM